MPAAKSEQGPLVALVGNPNAGKTTLFNQLTGSQQRVGNWSGVTVEKKSGEIQLADKRLTLVDLPGTYSLQRSEHTLSLDQQIAQQFVMDHQADAFINIVDASSLERGLFLTMQLLECGVPVVVALNMMDVAKRRGLQVDVREMSQRLGCPVVPIVASRRQGIADLLEKLEQQLDMPFGDVSLSAQATEKDINSRYEAIAQLLSKVRSIEPQSALTTTERIDSVVLNRFIALPLFLVIMYLMFMFTIHLGGAFIDVFDGVAGVLFVEAPRHFLEGLPVPAWLVTALCDGLGGGVQLVASFIPIIGSLFLFQSVLETSGYMARAAFIVDRLMRSLGLPGKSFVPLIVGFGCNVPSVMGARTLDRHADRLLTVLMAPFMSCGARLTVYVLFATMFFPDNAANVIFLLYLIGILLAVFTGLALKRQLFGNSASHFIMELPNYHVPHWRSVLILAWNRLKGFVVRAGKAIVLVVLLLNFVNSWGVDGSFGNQDTEQSMLSHIGKQITPLFGPIGVSEDNWPATVGIFSGVFAKEVVIGTLDALYGGIASAQSTTEAGTAGAESLMVQLAAALQTVPDNLSELADVWGDPLGIGVEDLSDATAAADAQGVELSTLSVMQSLFQSPLAAFAYLVFVLLYMPCVATLGAIYKEVGAFWAIFSASWNTILAYTSAVLVYQSGMLTIAPVKAVVMIMSMLLVLTLAWFVLIYFARKEASTDDLIPVVNL